jgi:hypothetical protein
MSGPYNFVALGASVIADERNDEAIQEGVGRARVAAARRA